jgi:hypothetical protein
MKNRVFIEFAGNNGTVAYTIPEITVDDVVKAVNKVFTNQIIKTSQGLATQVYDRLRLGGIQAELTPTNLKKNCDKVVKFTYYVHNPNFVYVEVYLLDSLGHRATSIYDDTLKNYMSNLKPVSKFTDKIGKLVRFEYTGGSHPGIRIIRLEEIKGSGATAKLCGVDVAVKEEEGERSAYRSFLLNKIQGATVEVLN